ncbi:MAG: hypothetical protein NZ929_05700 [Aigarchaeota archaeon]|nr:hypothetical protein [Aigarchaeota archaeon]MCX8193099.1 hypothetical protein [Nitrososphaeria archaeon]
MNLHEIVSKALEAVREKRVKLYVFRPSNRKLWIVVGRHGYYMVLPDSGYCTCSDFFFRVISGEKPTCYHLAAVKKAREEKTYSIIEKEDRQYRKIINGSLKERGSSE